MRSREDAREAIATGQVTVAGAPADKPARMVGPDEPIALAGPPPRFVGRAGHKLDAALDGFDVDVAGRRVLDAGASTGGFTDCLLQRGAREVVAVDVGYGQRHERLRHDPRVVVRDRTNVRYLTADDVGGGVDLVCVDLSFISVRTALPALWGLLGPGAEAILLVKPQFEAGRHEAARGRGVIRDPDVWRRVLEEVRGAAATLGGAMMGAMVSPITGADGNVEFLVHLQPGDPSDGGVDLDATVAEAVAVHGS